VFISISKAIKSVGWYTIGYVTHGQCDITPMITFQDAQHHCPLSTTKLSFIKLIKNTWQCRNYG